METEQPSYVTLRSASLQFDQLKNSSSILSNKNCSKLLRQRLSLNLNDTNAQNRKRKSSRCRLFNLNSMWRMSSSVQPRRLSRFDCAWDLSTNPLSEDCVNPFADNTLNGKDGHGCWGRDGQPEREDHVEGTPQWGPRCEPPPPRLVKRVQGKRTTLKERTWERRPSWRVRGSHQWKGWKPLKGLLHA